MVGLNFRMPETCAAIGAVQIGRLPGMLSRRRQQVAAYRKALEAAKLDARLGVQIGNPGSTWQTFAVMLPEKTDRARVITRLRDAEIEAGPATFALHRIDSMARLPGMSAARLPIADALHDRALALPLYHELTDDEIASVVAALGRAIA
jgi:dTDP-4-amino-4,6-dideoxygalactose transaminase